MIETILVTGSWGFNGRSTDGKSINALVALDKLWILSHDGTPEGYHAAWNRVKANCARECCGILRPAMPPQSIVSPEDWQAGNPTLFGVAGIYQFLTVVRTF